MTAPVERPVGDLLPWDELRVLRHKEGSTLVQLAEAAGISFGHLGDLERGRREPTPAVIKKLAAVLDVPQYMLRKRTRNERRDVA